MKVLVTGAAGYIGCHACIALLDSGHELVALDNYSNSSPVSLRRVMKIAGCDFPVVEADVNNRDALDCLFRDHTIDAVMHFAGLKAVGESCLEPLVYYHNNVAGSVVLLEAMQAAGIQRFIFSSSATVYGDPATTPITEDFPLQVTNPYGRSKLMIEEILQDLVAADEIAEKHFWRIAILRYFNPVGAHPSGLVGEDPKGIPNNLLPYITQVAVGKLPKLLVFGGDYPTSDGTGVRDYLHVMDLAEGHVKALEALMSTEASSGCRTWNLGTGNGISVLDMIRAFESVAKCQIPYEIVARRPGDVAECWSDASKAERELGWKAYRGLDEMMADSWRWQSDNPDGYPISED